MIEISEFSDFNKIRQHKTGDFVLVSDIDASETRDWNNGRGFEPINNFKGTLDGQGYTISNIYIDRYGWDEAFMKSMIDGVIKNLKIQNFYVNGKQDSSFLVSKVDGGEIRNVDVKKSVAESKRSNLGGITSSMYNNSKLENCRIRNCKIIGGSSSVGGIVGHCERNSIIEKCQVLNSKVKNKKTPVAYLGGLIGKIKQKRDIRRGKVKNVKIENPGREKYSGTFAGQIDNINGIGSNILKSNFEVRWLGDGLVSQRKL